MPDLFIIDESWQEQQWVSTGGTRAKKLFAGPDNKYYYFKESEYKPAQNGKPEKDYKYEFWSEIIAYEIGTVFGFNVLKYDIAIAENVVGCISESMINADREELIQGIQYLQHFNPDFDPNEYSQRKKYTFQLIENAIREFTYYFAEGILNNMIEMFVFDAIIGNTDRHQENWAIINEYGMEDLPGFTEMVRVIYQVRIAQIYDNGSSLGRELNDNGVKELLLSDNRFLQYISRGKSEVHWLGNKISHFELLQNLIAIPEYGYIIRNCINRIVQVFNSKKLEEIIENVDDKLPDDFSQYRIPGSRKLLIRKLITLRIEKLNEMLQ